NFLPMKLHLQTFYRALKILAASLPLTIFCLPAVYASHSAGGNITFTHVSGNTYVVHVAFYRDCVGIAAPGNVPLNISSNSCGLSLSATANPLVGTGQEITYPCPGNPTTCTIGTEPGIQKWEYEAQITLPAQCTDWLISWSYCCRNAAITTLQNP